MTQDAQKFTEEDLKNAKVLFDKFVEAGMVCDQEERDIVPPIAQALRDERKGLEDRVRELENCKNINTVYARIKALEAENEKLRGQGNFDPKLWESIKDKEWGSACRDLHAGYVEQCKALGSLREIRDELQTENARLKAEVERLKLAVNSWMSSSTRWCEKNDASEARLAEAVMVLKECNERFDEIMDKNNNPDSVYRSASFGRKLSYGFLQLVYPQAEKPQEPSLLESELKIIKRFYDKVCVRAEENMLKTGKLEGSHFAAMRTIIAEYEAQAQRGGREGV